MDYRHLILYREGQLAAFNRRQLRSERLDQRLGLGLAPVRVASRLAAVDRSLRRDPPALVGLSSPSKSANSRSRSRSSASRPASEATSFGCCWAVQVDDSGLIGGHRQIPGGPQREQDRFRVRLEGDDCRCHHGRPVGSKGAVRGDFGQQRLVGGPDQAQRRPDDQRTVPAFDVADQVGQRLRQIGLGNSPQCADEFGRGGALVECPPDAGRGKPPDDGGASALPVRAGVQQPADRAAGDPATMTVKSDPNRPRSRRRKILRGDRHQALRRRPGAMPHRSGSPHPEPARPTDAPRSRWRRSADPLD